MNFQSIISTDMSPAINNVDNTSNLLERLREPGQSKQDHIRLLDQIHFESELQKKDLLEKALPGWSREASFLVNGPILYTIKDCTRWETRQAFSKSGMSYGCGRFSFYYHSRTWVNLSNGATGIGIVSLLSHILGTHVLHVITWIAATLGIRIDTTNTQQIDMPPNHDFIGRPEILGPTLRPAHWLLGMPASEICFTTEFNSPSFILKEWREANEIVHLFCTLSRSNETGELCWAFVRPPVKDILFNRHRLYRERSLPVCVYEDIALAARDMNHPDYVATWSGEKDFAANIDWSLLANREVSYASSLESANSYIIGDELTRVFSQIGARLTLEKIERAYNVF